MKTTNKKPSHGGPRAGAGRPKTNKMAVVLWVSTENVENIGGPEIAKTLAEKAIQDKAKKTSKKT